ncbi:DUF456 domain-containing protein [Filibacter tadaridae]|uniref:DUF456 domain-containing protein n=1 Tax=Filibacter tadaridae TaxID=2483811 RepID=A0A3P5XPW6_9BACL|nr:DUF456 family protein [Filibacter tadaridae]VDC32439.1 hypothetical protein FILTAD_02667 [Filibacter tadaridae]
MEIIAWVLTIIMFIVAFIGLVYPIIPSAFFILSGFLLYGLFDTFEGMTVLFWVIQVLFILLLFGADTLSNLVGVKKFGGSKAGMWGSTIGLLIGPFVIPVFGILVGPFLGAVIAELVVSRSGVKQSIKTGIGSLVGFFTSVLTKGIVMGVMIVVFVMFVK